MTKAICQTCEEVYEDSKEGKCPNCGSSHAVESKTNLVECTHCGGRYIIPKKVLDMM